MNELTIRHLCLLFLIQELVASFTDKSRRWSCGCLVQQISEVNKVNVPLFLFLAYSRITGKQFYKVCGIRASYFLRQPSLTSIFSSAWQKWEQLPRFTGTMFLKLLISISISLGSNGQSSGFASFCWQDQILHSLVRSI